MFGHPKQMQLACFENVRASQARKGENMAQTIFSSKTRRKHENAKGAVRTVAFARNLLHLNRPGQVRIPRVVAAVRQGEIAVVEGNFRLRFVAPLHLGHRNRRGVLRV